MPSTVDILKRKQEAFNKEIRLRIAKEQMRLKKKAKEELHSHLEFALTGLKLDALRDLDNIHFIYGIFEIFSKLSKAEKENLMARSKELEEMFRLARKPKLTSENEVVDNKEDETENEDKK